MWQILESWGPHRSIFSTQPCSYCYYTSVLAHRHFVCNIQCKVDQNESGLPLSQAALSLCEWSAESQEKRLTKNKGGGRGRGQVRNAGFLNILHFTQTIQHSTARFLQCWCVHSLLSFNEHCQLADKHINIYFFKFIISFMPFKYWNKISV